MKVKANHDSLDTNTYVLEQLSIVHVHMYNDKKKSARDFHFSFKVGGYSYQTGSRILSSLVLFLHCERHKQ
jgi:hypothetical protein